MSACVRLCLAFIYGCVLFDNDIDLSWANLSDIKKCCGRGWSKASVKKMQRFCAHSLVFKSDEGKPELHSLVCICRPYMIERPNTDYSLALKALEHLTPGLGIRHIRTYSTFI